MLNLCGEGEAFALPVQPQHPEAENGHSRTVRGPHPTSSLPGSGLRCGPWGCLSEARSVPYCVQNHGQW